MKITVIVVSLVAYASAGILSNASPDYNTAYGYLTKYGIPEAKRIQEAEDKYLRDKSLGSRIIGGFSASSGQFKYQVKNNSNQSSPFQQTTVHLQISNVGLLSDIIGMSNIGVCGGSLITPNRVLTAAHCWFDGLNRAWRFTAILGTELLFTGGTRIITSDVTLHPHWTPFLIINDIAIIRLPGPVNLSEAIGTVSLPTELELTDSFNGQLATASGFGYTSNNANITEGQLLSYVNMYVISNEVCNIAFFGNIRDSHICTNTLGGLSTCRGDSGGPLVVQSNDRTVQIGITSFGIDSGCDIGWPAAFTRVTSFLGFINDNL